MSGDVAAPGAMIAFRHERLREVGARILVAAGATGEDAALVSDHLVEANLAGHDSHGVGMVPAYVRHLKAGLVLPNTHAKVVKDDGAGFELAAQDLGGAHFGLQGIRGVRQVEEGELFNMGPVYILAAGALTLSKIFSFGTDNREFYIYFSSLGFLVYLLFRVFRTFFLFRPRRQT